MIKINLLINLYILLFNCRAFSKKELEDLKSLFASLAAQSQTNNQYIVPSVFKVSLISSL